MGAFTDLLLVLTPYSVVWVFARCFCVAWALFVFQNRHHSLMGKTAFGASHISRATFPILSGILLCRKPPKIQGNRDRCLKRTMLEKNGKGIRPCFGSFSQHFGDQT